MQEKLFIAQREMEEFPKTGRSEIEMLLEEQIKKMEEDRKTQQEEIDSLQDVIETLMQKESILLPVERHPKKTD